MPLPGYAIGSDSTLHTITLTHHSGMKNLCDTFKLEENALFEEYVYGWGEGKERGRGGEGMERGREERRRWWGGEKERGKSIQSN